MKAKIIFLSIVISLLSIISYSQEPTLSITPTTLSLGNIELLTTTDGSHYFDLVIGSGTAWTIYVEAYVDDGTYGYSSTYEVSVDGGSTWGYSMNFTSDPAGETKPIYVRCSPTQNITDHTQSEIWVFGTSNSDYIDQASVTIVTPEMDMYGGSSVIAIGDGDASPSTTDSTDFGNVSINSTSKVTYTIKNNKGGPPQIPKGRLFLEDIGSSEYITISGTDASMFSVSSQPTVPINYGGGSTTFKIAFTPTSSGTKTASISIGNNDPNENPYNFDIQGTGSASVPTVTTTSPITSITSSTASGGGNVTDDGGATVTARGICWNTSTDPTTSNSHTTDGTGTGSFSSSLTSLTDETHYYVRAYGTNSGGTGYGSNVEFWTLSTEPSTQASSVTTIDKSGTTIELSWTGATGADGYLILQKAGSTAPTASGVDDGESYSSFSLPSGTTVAAEVTSTSHEITGLSASTQYSFTIIPFAKGSDNATYNYKTDGTLATKTESTVSSAPSTQASGIVWGTYGANQMEFSWTGGDGDGQILLMKANSAADDPVNGTSYTGSTTFGSGDEIGAGTFVVYRGSGSKGNIVVDNVSSSTLYYFKVMEYSGTGSQTAYNMDEAGGHNVGNSESSALPIELISFTAKLTENGKVIINWITGSETNNNYFTIEKTNDLENWQVLSNVNGAGNSLVENSYSSKDNNPFEGITYYRLKQTDFNGEFSYSDIVFVDNSNSENQVVFETPYKIGSSIQTILYNQSGKTMNVEIINLLGHVIYKKEIKPEADVHLISINMDKFTDGIYLLRIRNDKDFKVQRFLNK